MSAARCRFSAAKSGGKGSAVVRGRDRLGGARCGGKRSIAWSFPIVVHLKVSMVTLTCTLTPISVETERMQPRQPAWPHGPNRDSHDDQRADLADDRRTPAQDLCRQEPTPSGGDCCCRSPTLSGAETSARTTRVTCSETTTLRAPGATATRQSCPVSSPRRFVVVGRLR